MIPSSGCPPWPPDHPRTLPRTSTPTPPRGARSPFSSWTLPPGMPRESASGSPLGSAPLSPPRSAPWRGRGERALADLRRDGLPDGPDPGQRKGLGQDETLAQEARKRREGQDQCPRGG